MLNIEKYKEDILNMRRANITCCASDLSHVEGCGCANKSCIECKKEALEWLLEEYTEPILDEVEKKYLSAVIKPFRDRVKYICKYYNTSRWTSTSIKNNAIEWISISIKNSVNIEFSHFAKGTMYQGMKNGKRYTLEELGL